MKKPRVIFIMSDRRSGSTLLENVLAKSPEIISVGELAMLNGHILREGGGASWDWNCSCRKPVLQCSFWQSVLSNKNFFEEQEIPLTKIIWKQKKFFTLLISVFPFLLRFILPSMTKNKRNADTIATVNKIYNSVFEISGKKIIVDSSKDPAQVSAIYTSERNFDMSVIWLKKDLRAIAASKNKWRAKYNERKYNLSILVMMAFFYKRICYAVSGMIAKNDLIELDYEQLATNTQLQLNRMINHFDIEQYEAPTHLDISGLHTIAGMPERFTNKPIVIDDAWKKIFHQLTFAYNVGGVLNKL